MKMKDRLEANGKLKFLPSMVEETKNPNASPRFSSTNKGNNISVYANYESIITKSWRIRKGRT